MYLDCGTKSVSKSIGAGDLLVLTGLARNNDQDCNCEDKIERESKAIAGER